MNARYYGKSVKKNEFGCVVDRYRPRVIISYKESEQDAADKVIRIIEKETGFSGDGFNEFGEIHVDFTVADRDEGDIILDAYRHAKKSLQAR